MIQGKNTITYNNLEEVFADSYQIDLLINNEKYEYDNNDQEYYKILVLFDEMLTGSRQVPALGVSLDNETRKAIKNGVWLEFNYDITRYNNDLPFDSLLIEVNQNYGGFNIIRKYNNKYEGRCFYINLENNSRMNKLYNYLTDK